MNAGYGHGYSVMQVLDAVDRVTNHEIKRVIGPRRLGDSAELISDNRRILATLPWRPQHDNLDQIVRDALAWERKLAERQD
jgi:UDP-glucose 4-epimerase